ncbi:hypothetical protein [Bacteriophage sp.]|nr:hypothetical protein [Bacteriophage sp.]
MSLFDKAISKYSGFSGYTGNSPTTEEEYNSLNWFNDWEKPDWKTLQSQISVLKYQNQRAAEYPPIADYLDGIVKGDQAQIDKYIADCQAVKAKYPKGE